MRAKVHVHAKRKAAGLDGRTIVCTEFGSINTRLASGLRGFSCIMIVIYYGYCSKSCRACHRGIEIGAEGEDSRDMDTCWNSAYPFCRSSSLKSERIEMEIKGTEDYFGWCAVHAHNAQALPRVDLPEVS